ncbi:hypothetical protein Dsin_021220 [Dipteronia sinensis]|uniref:3'-5' exonuclease domain-containing protein n=1 Tax=Dipteronia sinensis TaxID=43782 RepID=A0AAD9ZZ89_9ROSI|nr:hypothetical protein Dsin_021220 [Dipteronia sinensis]
MEDLREPKFSMADGQIVTTHQMIHDDGGLDLFLKRFWEQGDMVVGFDTDWSFGEYEAQVSLLKLCSQGNCLLIKLDGTRHSYFRPLKELFANKDIAFVGVHIKKDLQKLESAYGFEIRNAVDLGEMAANKYKRPCLGACGVSDLVTAVFKIQSNYVIPSMRAAKVDYRVAETLTEEKKMEYATALTYAIYKTAKLLLK